MCPPLYTLLQYTSGDQDPCVLGVRIFPPAIRFYTEKLFFFVFIWGLAMLEGYDNPHTHEPATGERVLEVSLVVYLFSCTFKTMREVIIDAKTVASYMDASDSWQACEL